MGTRSTMEITREDALKELAGLMPWHLFPKARRMTDEELADELEGHSTFHNFHIVAEYRSNVYRRYDKVGHLD